MNILRNGVITKTNAAENAVIRDTRNAALLDRATTDAAVKRARRHAELFAEFDLADTIIDLIDGSPDPRWNAKRVRLQEIRNVR